MKNMNTLYYHSNKIATRNQEKNEDISTCKPVFISLRTQVVPGYSFHISYVTEY